MDSTIQRLMRELCEMRSDHLNYLTVDTEENDILRWKGTLSGPPGTPYEGGLFEFQLDFPQNYPDHPPSFKFNTPIFHPNISPCSGNVCLQIFSKYCWNSRYTPKVIISYIIALLNKPNAAGGFQSEATTAMRESSTRFQQMAREFTLRYAMDRLII